MPAWVYMCLCVSNAFLYWLWAPVSEVAFYARHTFEAKKRPCSLRNSSTQIHTAFFISFRPQQSALEVHDTTAVHHSSPKNLPLISFANTTCPYIRIDPSDVCPWIRAFARNRLLTKLSAAIGLCRKARLSSEEALWMTKLV